MEIAATVPLSPGDRQALAGILGCTEQELDATFGPYAAAAALELAAMILGKAVFSRGSDLLEHRLLLLIQHALGSRIPTEQTVSRLFQSTASHSRALIRAVMSKYQYQLRPAIQDSLHDLVDGADPGNGGLTLSIHSANLVDELNRVLAEIDASLPAVQRVRSTVSTYDLAPSSYLALCEQLGVTSKLPAAT